MYKDNEQVKSGFVLDPIIQSLSAFQKGMEGNKGIMQKEGRQVGRTHTAHYQVVGRYVGTYSRRRGLLASFHVLIAPSTQVHSFQKMQNNPFLCPQLFVLFGSRTKRTFSSRPFPSLPFHSIPFFLKKWTTFCFQFLFSEFVIFGCICYVVFWGVFIMVLFICGVCARSHFDWPIITKLYEQWTSLQ